MYRGSRLLLSRTLPFGRLPSPAHGCFGNGISNLHLLECDKEETPEGRTNFISSPSILSYVGIPRKGNDARHFHSTPGENSEDGAPVKTEESVVVEGSAHNSNPHESTFHANQEASSRFKSELKLPQTVDLIGNNSNNTTGKARQRQRFGKGQRRKRKTERLPSEWVTITDTPKFAALGDILMAVEEVLLSNEEAINEALIRDSVRGEDEVETGIDSDRDVSVGSAWANSPKNLREFQEKHALPSHLVSEARMILSRMKRPAGWFLRFPSPTIAREFALATKVKGRTRMKVGSKLVEVSIAYDPQHTNPVFEESVEGLNLDDSVVRMERVHRNVPPQTIRGFFRNHLLADERFGRSAVEKVVHGVGSRYRAHSGNPRPDYKQPPHLPEDESLATVDSDYCTYLIRFEDASWARAAVRERQGVPLLGERVFLMQYPKQLLRNPQEVP